jgi:regulator of protease activity HflC (stomatin/prohibitin superfamily)
MEASFLPGVALGVLAWFCVRYGLTSFFTVNQNERAVKTRFGRAERLLLTIRDNPVAEDLSDEEQQRYKYPQLRVIPPGGPYFKWPWEQVYKVSVATTEVPMALDPENPGANHGGQMLEAVTKDQLNTGLIGQLRYRVSEQNLYAFLFGVKNPIAHVMGYFVSILRERIANFEAPIEEGEERTAFGVSINDLRKNLRDLNEHMDRECQPSTARYGITLEATLITGIDPPDDVDSALAAINTAHNQVSSEVSLAQASADQKLVQSRRAVEIETLKSQAEVEPLVSLAAQLSELKQRGGSEALTAYVRNVRLSLYHKAQHVFLGVDKS